MSKKHITATHLLKYPNVISRWYLFMRGNRDAKKGLLELNSGCWRSAFICKEISTAKADIEEERKAFYTNNTHLIKKMMQIDVVKKELMTRFPKSNIRMPATLPCKSSYVEIDDSFTQVIMNSCVYNVLYAREFAQQKKIEYHNDRILSLELQKEDYTNTLMRRYTASHAKATHICDILRVRLAIYWSGIAKAVWKNNPNGLPKTCDCDAICGMKDIENIINKYFVDMEDANYGKQFI